MPKYTEYLNIAVQPELKLAIDEEAARQGRTLSAMARYTLERVYLKDEITVAQCLEEMDEDMFPIVVRQPVDEFITGKVEVGGGG